MLVGDLARTEGGGGAGRQLSGYLGRLRFGRGRFLGRRRRAIDLRQRLVVLVHQRHRHQLVAVLEHHQTHTLSGAADRADVAGGRAQDLALLGDEQQLLVELDVGVAEIGLSTTGLLTARCR